MESTSHFVRKTFSPRSGETHFADMPAEEWVEQVGAEGRGNRPRERDPDQWFKQNFMSEQARSIERSLGVD